MKTSQEGIDLIKSFEGLRLKAYKPISTEKYFTIGYGHYGEDVKEGMTITQKQAEDLLKKDLERYEGYVEKYAGYLNLNQHEVDALTSFCYNCGAGNLKKLCKDTTKSHIADVICNYNHAGGKELAGLTRRRKAERELFLKPVEKDAMKIIIGSARIDENGKAVGGKGGDQKQKSTPDYSGEVSLQEFYEHSKGWYILRPKDSLIADDLSGLMRTACNNPNIGYNQNSRLEIIRQGVFTTTPANCDCGTLVRVCIMTAAGMDPGNFTTATEADALERTGLFEKRVKYTKGMKLYEGDVLITCSKGHTVIVVEGYKRTSNLTNNDQVDKKIKLEIEMPLIKRGSKGNAVALWNLLLGNIAYICEFDEIMYKQTKAFQEKYNLEVDGIVGKQSWTEGFKRL